MCDVQLITGCISFCAQDDADKQWLEDVEARNAQQVLYA
jgi:hypothetical protein